MPPASSKAVAASPARMHPSIPRLSRVARCARTARPRPPPRRDFTPPRGSRSAQQSSCAAASPTRAVAKSSAQLAPRRWLAAKRPYTRKPAGGSAASPQGFERKPGSFARSPQANFAASPQAALPVSPQATLPGAKADTRNVKAASRAQRRSAARNRRLRIQQVHASPSS